jgi:hypothetical protein
MTTPVECVILDIPDGLRLDLLGLVVEIGRVRIVADRAGLLGGLLASLTCGGLSRGQSRGHGPDDPDPERGGAAGRLSRGRAPSPGRGALLGLTPC